MHQYVYIYIVSISEFLKRYLPLSDFDDIKRHFQLSLRPYWIRMPPLSSRHARDPFFRIPCKFLHVYMLFYRVLFAKIARTYRNISQNHGKSVIYGIFFSIFLSLAVPAAPRDPFFRIPRMFLRK